MYCFVINKTSGNGRSVKIWGEIEQILKERKVSYTALITNNKQEVI